MDEFEQYLSNRTGTTATQDSMAEYNRNLGKSSDDEFSQYLGVRNGLTPDRKARLEAKHQKNQAEIAGLKAEQSREDSPSGYLGAATDALYAGTADILNKSTFGAYKKIRDNPSLSPLIAAARTAMPLGDPQKEADYSAPIQNNPLMRAAQLGTNALNSGVGYAVGPAGLVGRGGAAIAKAAGGGLLGGAVGGAMAGGLTGGAEAAVQGASPTEAMKSAGMGAAGGGLLGGAVGAIGKGIAGAPKRAFESEMAGLTENVSTKNKINKFLPREDEIRQELSREPALRRIIKDSPGDAPAPVVKKLQQVAEGDLEPFYQDMVRAGKGGMDPDLAVQNLETLKTHFTKHAEAAPRAVIDQLINGIKEDAAVNGGQVSAQALREEATAYQAQGFANVPMLGPVQLSKEVKQGIGGALRESIAQHLELMMPTDATGKAYGQMFRDANKRVSNWYAIKDLVDESAARAKTNSPTLMGQVGKIAKFAFHGPKAAALSMIPSLGPGAESFNRNILSPLAQSPTAQGVGQGIMGLAGQAGANETLDVTGRNNAMQRAIEEKKRQDEQGADMLLSGGQY